MKRSTYIFIRVSEEEKSKLVTLAAKDGLTVSAWVRRFAYIGAPHWQIPFSVEKGVDGE